MAKEIVRMKNIVKSYPMGGEDQIILKGIDFHVNEGEFISILGPSGSGKSTLMNILGCLDRPTSGEYNLSGKSVTELSEKELTKIRSHEVGFVFQSFQLLPRLSALENVELPLIYAGIPTKERSRIAKEMLIRVGLEERLDYYPRQLSGGQQQRVAIARALSTNPSILLADEPTGALDQNTGKQVIHLFGELHQEGRTIIMITHDEAIAKHADRVTRILDGRITDQEN